jgi:hypothetical protein
VSPDSSAEGEQETEGGSEAADDASSAAASGQRPAAEAASASGGAAGSEPVPAGWYPDPRQPNTGQQRYWDGVAWTDRIASPGQATRTGQAPGAPGPAAMAAPAISTERKTPEERRAILAQQVQFAAARGRRIESQSDYQAVLVTGQPVNHTLHAILTIFTCLLWGIVWAIIAGTGGEKREMVVVDEFGNVQYTALGKA